MFGNKKKDTTNTEYAQLAESIPVATAIITNEPTTAYQSNVAQATAPIAPSEDVKPNGPCQGMKKCGGGGWWASSKPAATATAATSSNQYSDDDPTISRFPMMMRECPNCHRESRTRVVTAPSAKTWVASGIMVAVFWPLCWIPLVSDSCKETDHFCVSCGAKVGHVGAFEDCCVERRS
uniref:LITAF domain-containing protein n=1 Tax=Pseudo-nitzschia australis TaxID=44445 RepID=A0A7S4AKY6_9STRA|mmetsp:Transcript_5370/g.11831  ORF Transcript_5370/g.11831 Transcript_5370/m.11831 type:complete len:179 (+) Transcript_5370:343-879(+)|eukprot:CAMPEP_0168168646 /NCGR_PEP_ID=MMETSP0139_2-20121125/3206_1 /TAXON_ID=44445 /ORGANISM="Pseudo-nitzschia australis, Strain 10249 10 AB" /LENGTH=178 /DNA_ID=CAMNT_0008085993 /DNA_START=597 /DNA_END=1133 /DNA_ORIENTATION=+